MATITLQGKPVSTNGDLPQPGSNAPDFTLVKADLTEQSLQDYAGKKVILNIFPSVDTGTCAMSVRKFNEKAAQLPNTAVLCVSMDLPFAQSRFCGAEGLDRVVTLSGFRSSFGEDYGVKIVGGPMSGLFARSVVVLDEQGKVIHTELVKEIADEPDYESALAAL